MGAMNNDTWTEYRQLKDNGWQVDKHNQVKFNGGSETIKHAVGKMLSAHAGKEAGYRIGSEVEHVERGEIDILLWGIPERLTLAVELETSPTQEVIDDKRERYVDETPIDDMIPINLNELPLDMLDAYGYIKQELGLDVEY